MVNKALLIGNDAEAVASALREAGTPPEAITVIPAERASMGTVKAALDALRAGTTTHDRILMHYTGPGGMWSPAESEAGPKDTVRLILDVSPNGTFYAVGGDREPGEVAEGAEGRPFIGKKRLDARMARERGGVAGLRIPTMDEGTRLLLDCLDKLDLASAYEFCIRVLPGDHDDKSLLRGEFIPVIEALRDQVDTLRLKGIADCKCGKRPVICYGGEPLCADCVDERLHQLESASCNTCHSQPARICNACLDSRDHELRATIDRLRRIVERLEKERAQFVSGVVDAVVDKGLEVGTEVKNLKDLLRQALAVLNLPIPYKVDAGLVRQFAPPLLAFHIEKVLAAGPLPCKSEPDGLEETYFQQESERSEAMVAAHENAEIARLKAENECLKDRIAAMNPQPTEAAKRYAVLLTELEALEDTSTPEGDAKYSALCSEMDPLWWSMAEWERADFNQKGHERAYKHFKAIKTENEALKVEVERLKKQWADHSCADAC